jgi:hypothetical protein
MDAIPNAAVGALGTCKLYAALQAEPGISVGLLRSNEFLGGFPDFTEGDSTRVQLANLLFQYACEIFLKATALGVLTTMEDPKSSYFWLTC